VFLDLLPNEARLLDELQRRLANSPFSRPVLGHDHRLYRSADVFEVPL
jgi:hypothetical protein